MFLLAEDFVFVAWVPPVVRKDVEQIDLVVAQTVHVGALSACPGGEGCFVDVDAFLCGRPILDG